MDGNRPSISFDPELPEPPADRATRLKDAREVCPIAWSPEHGGFWLLTRHADIVEILTQPDLFSSAKTVDLASGQFVGGTILPPVPMRFIPSETDSPEWDRYRGVLNPHFGPGAVAQRRAGAVKHAHALIDRAIDRGRIDLVLDLGNPLSAIVTMTMLDFPLDDWQRWAAPFHETVYLPASSPELGHALRELDWVFDQIRHLIAQRRHVPRDDLLSRLMAAPLTGGPLGDAELLDLAVQVLGGAIETTTALAANAFLYLDSDRDARERLRTNPKALRRAFDEFLRYFSPVPNQARTVVRDIEIAGQRLCAGERLLLSFASANRDALEFDAPDEVRMDRFPNRHLAMGRGKHFCLGAFQARMMFEVMLEAVLERVPDYAILREEMRPYPSIGNVNGWITMPACFAGAPSSQHS